MAMSKTMHIKGQQAMNCQLCEIDPKLKGKCLECGLIICQRCLDKVHPKFPSAQEHTIIDIKDIDKIQEEQKLDFTKLMCHDHVGKHYCLYCEPCDQLVCPLCITKNHKKHDLVEIAEGYKFKVEKIKTEHEKIKNALEILVEEENELKQIKDQEDSSYNRSIQNIQEHEKILKTHINDFKNDLKLKWKAVIKSVDEEQKKVTERKETVLQKNEEVNDILNCNDAQKVFSFESKETNRKSIKTTFNHVLLFVPGDVRNLKSEFGKLVSTSYTDIEVVGQYTSDVRSVCGISVCPSGSLWIKDDLAGVVQKIKPIGDKLKIKSTLKLQVSDISLTASGDLLVLTCDSSVIKVISSGVEKLKDSPYNISPLVPVCIHVSHDNRIILGAVDTGPWFPARGPRQVIVLNQSGQKENIFQYDGHNKPVFTFPYDVTITCYNNIGVLDWLSKDGLS